MCIRDRRRSSLPGLQNWSYIIRVSFLSRSPTSGWWKRRSEWVGGTCFIILLGHSRIINFFTALPHWPINDRRGERQVFAFTFELQQGSDCGNHLARIEVIPKSWTNTALQATSREHPQWGDNTKIGQPVPEVRWNPTGLDGRAPTVWLRLSPP